jgi:hypothetical protein
MNQGQVTINFVGKEIISSGTVVVIDELIIFEMFGISFTFKFEDDKDKTEHDISEVSNDGKNAVYRLVNFNNSLGTGTITPFRMGNVKGNKILMAFVINTLKNNTRVMHYTWYLEVPDGK